MSKPKSVEHMFPSQRFREGAHLILLVVVLLFLEFAVAPYQQPFRTNDIDISYPHLPDFVPMWLVVMSCQVLPLMVLLLVCQFYHSCDKRPCFFYLVIGYLTAIGLVYVITDLLKVQLGRLRPDFLDRCQPEINVHGWINGTLCTGNPSIITEGRKSFPSGHSSGAYSGVIFLILYLIDMLEWTEWVFFGCFVWFMGATSVALSRVQQHVHHPTDVIAGSFIGIVVSMVTYWTYRRKMFFIGKVPHRRVEEYTMEEYTP
jgi:diacylglycerol diphosphate phosphatase/phosphatidate phosphatase